MSWVIAGAALAAVVGALLYGRAEYYWRMFSVAHFREVHSTLLSLLEKALVSEEHAGGPTGAVTSAGLILGVTHRRARGARRIHISLSQERRTTTAAVANRFAFFLMTILSDNKLELDVFFTSSGIYHLVLGGACDDLASKDFVATFETYRSSYRPLPFSLRTLEGGTADSSPGRAG